VNVDVVPKRIEGLRCRGEVDSVSEPNDDFGERSAAFKCFGQPRVPMRTSGSRNVWSSNALA